MVPRRSTTGWGLEVISLASVLSSIAIVAVQWNALPAQVPLHFGASGQADGWGSKSGIWLLPAISAFLYLVLTVASRYQRLINLPFRVDRDAPEVRRLLLHMMIVLKTEMTLIFAYITWGMVETALGRSEGLGIWFLPVLLIATTLPLIYYLAKLRRYRSR
jgi:uncharacterized membrane protein